MDARCYKNKGWLPHAVARLHRPALHVAAAWLLGATIQFFVGDEDLPKGSATQIGMLATSQVEAPIGRMVCSTFDESLTSKLFEDPDSVPVYMFFAFWLI